MSGSLDAHIIKFSSQHDPNYILKGDTNQDIIELVMKSF